MTARRRSSILGVSLVTLFALGCHEPTEIIVVVDTDLTLGKDFDQIDFSLGGGFQGQVASATRLPATLGVVPPDTNGQVIQPPEPSRGGGDDSGLSIMVQATTFANDMPTIVNGVPILPAPIALRGASGLQFVDGKELVLFLPLYRRCMCAQNVCPNLTETDCKDIISPVLPEFDEDHVPRIPAASP
jgi:hypothetical protein